MVEIAFGKIVLMFGPVIVVSEALGVLASDITCFVGRDGRERCLRLHHLGVVWCSSVLISLSGLQLLHLTGAVLAPASQVCCENSGKPCPQKAQCLNT